MGKLRRALSAAFATPITRRNSCDVAICSPPGRARVYGHARQQRLPELLVVPRLRSAGRGMPVRRLRHTSRRLGLRLQQLRRRKLRLLRLLGWQLQHLQWRRWRLRRRSVFGWRLPGRGRIFHRRATVDYRTVIAASGSSSGDAARRVSRLKISGSNGSFGCQARTLAPRCGGNRSSETDDGTWRLPSSS